MPESPSVPARPPSHRSALAACALFAVLLVLTVAGSAAAVDRPTRPERLTVISTAQGAALADVKGNPLYLRDADRPNTPGCTGRCPATWPAAVGRPTKGPGVTGTVTRSAHHAPGSTLRQVVLNRHPLYYYRHDTPRRPTGQTVGGFSLVSPHGTPLPSRRGEIAEATARPRSPTPTHTPAAPPASHPTTPRTATPRTAAPRTSAAPRTPRPTATRSSAAPRTTAPRSAAASEPSGLSSPVVGALQMTPSGAAEGGAVHPVAAPDTPVAVATRLTLAIGATAAAGAVALLVRRRLRRDPTGGDH